MRLLLIMALTLVAYAAQTIRFDATLGTLPAGWTSGMTHQGGSPKWEVVSDPSAPSPTGVMAQTSTDSTAGRFPFAIYDGASITDGSVSVRFRPVAGRVDQAAGLIWRFRDADNYYVARANALENNVAAYKVEKGERISLRPLGTPSRTYGIKHVIPQLAWSTLRVDFAGTRFSLFLNGTRLLDVEDSTFAQAGKAGVWTKADSVIHFDDFAVSEISSR